jgi:hypothetical protein
MTSVASTTSNRPRVLNFYVSGGTGGLEDWNVDLLTIDPLPPQLLPLPQNPVAANQPQTILDWGLIYRSVVPAGLRNADDIIMENGVLKGRWSDSGFIADSGTFVPDGAFWSLRSSQLSAATIAAYNAKADSLKPFPTDNQQRFAFAGNQRIHFPINMGPTNMDPDGRLHFRHDATSPQSHTQIQFNTNGDYDGVDARWGTCSSLPLKLGREYRFEFEMEIVDNGEDWWDNVSWLIPYQLWGWYDAGDALFNPAFALEIWGTLDPPTKWRIVQRGASAAAHTAYETEEEVRLPFTGPGVYRMRHDYKADYNSGGDGFSHFYIDDELVFSHTGQTAFNSLCEGTKVGPVPYVGPYGTQLPAPGVEILFDNMVWRRMGGL